MAYKIKLPETYAKIIAEKSKRADSIDKHAVGVLTGILKNDSIIIDGIVPASFVTGYDFMDTLKKMLGLPADTIKLIFNHHTNGVFIPYESNPFLASPEKIAPDKYAKATVFYYTDSDYFGAVNERKEAELIEIVSDDGCISEVFGEQTPESDEKSDTVLDKPCTYEVFAQLGARSNISIKLSYDATFSPGIAGEGTLIFDNFMSDVLNGLGFTGHLFSKKRVRHLEIKRDDGTIIWKY